jgi:hypothetical protein
MLKPAWEVPKSKLKVNSRTVESLDFAISIVIYIDNNI